MLRASCTIIVQKKNVVRAKVINELLTAHDKHVNIFLQWWFIFKCFSDFIVKIYTICILLLLTVE